MKFDNSYRKLPNNFYSILNPIPVQKPELVMFNEALAKELGFNFKELEEEKIVNYLAGNEIFPGSKPISLAYAGHQFGHFVPTLGDGRAHLLGEIITPKNKRFDIQLKGSGQTPYSRNGDGRAAFGPMLREYIVSEAMFSLKIPTTRSLAVVKSGELVYRETPQPGAILTRIAKSHIRVGTFEYFAARSDLESVKILANYTISRYFPKLKNNQNIYLDFLLNVAINQAKLIANWMSVGFIHGVMNTDNMAISGETIDYGPCAFLDQYIPGKKFSFIDRYGRYAYSNQPNIGLWNIMQLYYCLYPLIHTDLEAEDKVAPEIIKKFQEEYERNYQKKFLNKIGIFKEQKGDQNLLENLLQIMEKDQLDFTLTFRYLSHLLKEEKSDLAAFFKHSGDLPSWISSWEQRLKQENYSAQEIGAKMQKINPAIIPRNHLVEQVLTKAVEDNDFEPAKKLIKALKTPFTEDKDSIDFINTPKESEVVHHTFCGT